MFIEFSFKTFNLDGVDNFYVGDFFDFFRECLITSVTLTFLLYVFKPFCLSGFIYYFSLRGKISILDTFPNAFI